MGAGTGPPVDNIDKTSFKISYKVSIAQLKPLLDQLWLRARSGPDRAKSSPRPHRPRSCGRGLESKTFQYFGFMERKLAVVLLLAKYEFFRNKAICSLTRTLAVQIHRYACGRAPRGRFAFFYSRSRLTYRRLQRDMGFFTVKAKITDMGSIIRIYRVVLGKENGREPFSAAR